MLSKKKTQQKVTSTDVVTQYALDVTSGKIIAGHKVRNSCARHLRDVEQQKELGLLWDIAAAERAINFFPHVLRLAGGEFEGVPYDLLPWQQFIVGSIFGWKNATDGYRRFRVVYVEGGKGCGKSPLAAGIGLYMMMADGEARAEIYAAATKKDQAMILFRDAVAMVDQSPLLSARITKSGRGEKAWNLAYIQAGSYFRPVSSDDGQSGYRPHCALIDEIHEHRSSNVVEMMRAGTKGRRQALILMITNSGFDRTSVCYDYHEYGAKVAAGKIEDDSFFSYVCGLDEGDDPFEDESCWIKANPSLGVTIQHKYLREQVTQAKGMPSKESIVRRLNFCEWVDAENPWIDGDLWRACEEEFNPDDLIGRECYAGLDLSGTRDLTAFAMVFPPMRAGDKHIAIVEYWTPAETLLERARVDRVPYDVWRDKGFVHAPSGRAVDYGFVVKRIGELSARYDIKSIAFDPYRIKYFEAEVASAGIELNLVPHSQGYFKSQQSLLWMPHSVDVLENMVMENKIRILKNPCLTWNSASAVLEADPKGNRIFTKRKSTGRIDGIVALAMAVGAADQQEDQQVTSIYETAVII